MDERDETLVLLTVAWERLTERQRWQLWMFVLRHTMKRVPLRQWQFSPRGEPMIIGGA